uniref:DhaK domain-containing protein n=1 Tax=Fagus sylvatica TaxID=28930 RepID=A0A2N9HZ82_FAGSY
MGIRRYTLSDGSILTTISWKCLTPIVFPTKGLFAYQREEAGDFVASLDKEGRKPQISLEDPNLKKNVWRPKLSPYDQQYENWVTTSEWPPWVNSRVTMVSGDPPLPSKNLESKKPEPCVEISAPFSSGGVDRVWGSSTTWMLELRDGRRMSITLSLLRIPASLEENEALALICPAGDTGLGSESKDQSPCNRLQVWSENDVDDDYVSAVWEDPIPSGLGSNSPTSPWVLETLIVCGIVLGASFEGYEEELMGILKVHDWELESISTFFDLLYSANVKGHGEYKLCWKLSGPKGGGSGHEPAHAGFVGEGMLTAAICGDVFASPPVDSILSGIRAVTGSMGCLLIVTNYTGDRLNFGLAAEQAKSEGYKVETVIVGDDCALPPPRGIAGRRGLAGTILVNKVAGAAAAAGHSLADVAAEAKHASEIVGTMGVALSVCTLPGQVTSDRLGPGKMELGLGIHGEPGAVVADLQPVDVVVSHVLKQILSQETNYVPITRGSRVVLMTNGYVLGFSLVL